MPIVNSSQRRSLVPRPIAKAWPPQVPLMKSNLQDTPTRSSRNLERASGRREGWLERPVLNSFSFDACIDTFAHLRFAPPTSAARCASVMNEPWTCSQHVERGGVWWPKRSGGGREFL